MNTTVVIIIAALAIVALTGCLLVMALMLKVFAGRLTAVIGTVNALAEKSTPIEPVAAAIQRDLDTAHEFLASLRENGVVPTDTSSADDPRASTPRPDDAA